MLRYLSAEPWGAFQDSVKPWVARWKGSVAPKALKWAVPASLLAAVYHFMLHEWTDVSRRWEEPSMSETAGWTLFMTILGFLIAFRAQLSYSRYWEGITLVEQACGVWLNGFSNLIAFCSTKPEKQEQVEEFQYLLSRLMSLLFCYAMCDISNLDRSRFPHLDLDMLDPASLVYLESTSSKQHVALQWIQRMVVEGARHNVIDIAPPILSRVFQELSIGIVHFMDAKKISVVAFPIEFARLMWVMLVFFSILPVPMLCAFGTDAYKAAGFAFVIVFIFWSVHYIAVEIEHPFGDDPNDLPLEKVNRRFNKVLQRLLEMRAQETPSLLRKPDMSMRYMRRTSTSNVGSPRRRLPNSLVMRMAADGHENLTHSEGDMSIASGGPFGPSPFTSCEPQFLPWQHRERASKLVLNSWELSQPAEPIWRSVSPGRSRPRELFPRGVAEVDEGSELGTSEQTRVPDDLKRAPSTLGRHAPEADNLDAPGAEATQAHRSDDATCCADAAADSDAATAAHVGQLLEGLQKRLQDCLPLGALCLGMSGAAARAGGDAARQEPMRPPRLNLSGLRSSSRRSG